MGKFNPGQIVITATALHRLEVVGHLGHEDHDEAERLLTPVLAAHLTGDWGELCAEDKQANEDALKTGARILSKYEVNGVWLYFITDAVESADHPRQLTTILLPEDY